MKRVFIYRNIIILIIFSALSDCSRTEFASGKHLKMKTIFRMKAVDISYLPTIRRADVGFRNTEGKLEDALITLKKAGINTIRLRIWNNPDNLNANLFAMKQFSEEIQKHGLKVYLALHYSDTWADPSHQTKPKAWVGLSPEDLQDSVYAFTKFVVQYIQPDYIQLGNEINNGFLWPEGRKVKSRKFLKLLQAGSRAVREASTRTKIILHYSGFEQSSLFFKGLRAIDYDIIGLSYYPKWHGSAFEPLEEAMNMLALKEKKPVLIAETAHPFTMQEADKTTNVIGGKQNFAPSYPASPEGQAQFVSSIKQLSQRLPFCVGFCYWGATWVSSNTMGSMWENQALWDFNYKALPAIAAFQ